MTEYEQVRELKTPGGPIWRGPILFFEFLPLGALTGSHSEDWRTISSCFQHGERKSSYFEIYWEHLCSEQALPSRETIGLEPNLLGFYQSLTDVREEKYPTTVPSSFLCGGMEITNSSFLFCRIGGDWEVFSVWSQPRSTSSLTDLLRTIEHVSSPHTLPPHHWRRVTPVTFTQYIMTSFQQKVTRHTKRKKRLSLKRQSTIRTRHRYHREAGITRLGS